MRTLISRRSSSDVLIIFMTILCCAATVINASLSSSSSPPCQLATACQTGCMRVRGCWVKPLTEHNPIKMVKHTTVGKNHTVVSWSHRMQAKLNKWKAKKRARHIISVCLALKKKVRTEWEKHMKSCKTVTCVRTTTAAVQKITPLFKQHCGAKAQKQLYTDAQIRCDGLTMAISKAVSQLKTHCAFTVDKKRKACYLKLRHSAHDFQSMITSVCPVPKPVGGSSTSTATKPATTTVTPAALTSV